MLIFFQIALQSSCGTMLFAVCLLFIIYRYRVAMFASFKLHPFDVDECDGEDMTYDVFLSCAYEDREVGQLIVDRLEQGRATEDHDSERHSLIHGGGYRVCYHERDFVSGSMITDNIEMAIEHSRRVVCLMTHSFLRSQFCMMEFRAAWSRCLRLNRRRLVVIKWPEVDVSTAPMTERRPRGAGRRSSDAPSSDNDGDGRDRGQQTVTAYRDARLFFSTFTYIEYNKRNWWQQLMYALPIKPLPPQQPQL
jgi:hypothetical protein